MYIVSEIQNEAFKNAYSINGIYVFLFFQAIEIKKFLKTKYNIIDLHALKNFYKNILYDPILFDKS